MLWTLAVGQRIEGVGFLSIVVRPHRVHPQNNLLSFVVLNENRITIMEVLMESGFIDDLNEKGLLHAHHEGGCTHRMAVFISQSEGK